MADKSITCNHTGHTRAHDLTQFTPENCKKKSLQIKPEIFSCKSLYT
jgi:hypothetical protein